MKNIFLLFLLVSLSGFGFAQNGATIVFDQESFDFGIIEEGPKVTTDFVFRNDGTEPLVLSNVKASCGCTVPDWPKEPILPGEEGMIKVTYNTANRKGGFNKSITVTSNATEPTKVVYIKGTVQAVPEEETLPVKEPTMMAPAAK